MDRRSLMDGEGAVGEPAIEQRLQEGAIRRNLAPAPRGRAPETLAYLRSNI